MSDACKRVVLQGAIPKRHIVQHEHNGIEYEAIYTGNDRDTSNFDNSITPDWDESKADYKIEDRVKLPELGKEYICGVDGTRKYPASSSIDWKEVGTMKEYRYRDGTPLSQSSKAYVDGENIEIELYLRSKDTYLFIQNMENIKEIIIEKYENNEWVELHREQLETCVAFSPCTCCLLEFDNKNNFTYVLPECMLVEKIRVSFVQVENTVGKVGTCAVGEYVQVGYLQEYPQPKVDTDSKFSIEEDGLALPKKVNIYLNYSISVFIDSAIQDSLYKKLIQESGRMNFYEIANYTDNVLTSFVGFHKGFTPTIKANGDMELHMDLYGIPSKGA